MHTPRDDAELVAWDPEDLAGTQLDRQAVVMEQIAEYLGVNFAASVEDDLAALPTTDDPEARKRH